MCLGMILDAVNRLAQYDPDIEPYRLRPLPLSIQQINNKG